MDFIILGLTVSALFGAAYGAYMSACGVKKNAARTRRHRMECDAFAKSAISHGFLTTDVIYPLVCLMYRMDGSHRPIDLFLEALEDSEIMTKEQIQIARADSKFELLTNKRYF